MADLRVDEKEQNWEIQMAATSVYLKESLMAKRKVLLTVRPTVGHSGVPMADQMAQRKVPTMAVLMDIRKAVTKDES